LDTRRNENREREETSTFLLGIGLDRDKGEFRVTRGQDFQILGGSERTHRRMQEKIMHLEEELARDGRSISGLKPDDYNEVTEFLQKD
jgi:hypothetical protein